MKYGRILASLLFCLIAVVPLEAQKYTQLSGVILDASLASVPSATVTVVNEDTGLRRETLSQADGAYVVSSLEPGVYKVTVRKPGFRTMIHFGVKLAESQPARVDFKLVIGSIQETITVESSAPLFNTEDASVGTVVGQEEVEHLPLDGRGLLGLIGLAPGAVVTPATRGESGQFTVDGQRPNTHYFTVDGASANTGVSGGGLPAQATGGTLPGLTAFGSLDGLLTPDALQEMRIQTSTSVSEFGRMPGAQISLTSRAGSNEFHGSVLYGFRNEVLDANDWFANRHGDSRAPLRLQDFSGGLGGPIWRNHTFFFISYEGMRLQQPFVWVQPVPSLDARTNSLPWADPLLSLFPAPNGPDLGGGLALWTGRTSRPSRLDAGAGRLDHAFSSRVTGFARYSNSPSSTEFGTAPVNTLDLRSQSVTLGLDWRAKPNWLMELRVNGTSADANSAWNEAGSTCSLEPTTLYFLHLSGICHYLVRLSIAGVGQVVSGSEGRRSQTQFQISPMVNWDHGTHSVRFGADYRRLAPSRTDSTGALGIVADNVAALAGGFFTNWWVVNSARAYASAVMQETSLYVQDTWRLSRHLTATYGIRWEISPAPHPGLGTTFNFFDPVSSTVGPSQRSLWQATYANFAPRFGVAFQPKEGGRTVIRAGAGLYYDSSLSLAADVVSGGPLSISGYKSNRGGPGTNPTIFFSGFVPELRLPLVRQWNVSIERAFTSHDVVSLGYVGSLGTDLIRREVGAPPDQTPPRVLSLATNDGLSIYHALQAQYRRRMAHGLEALVSYSWSHSIDNSSTDSGLYRADSGMTSNLDRASSDFDVRHSLSAGFTYALPHSTHGPLLRDWELDGIFTARTGFPINVLNADEFQGFSYENVYRPNLVGGVPVWLSDPSAPGGRRIDPAAFQALPVDPSSGNGRQGNLGRNALSGFGMSQLDLAMRREFLLGEQRSLQLRVEAYNALNHPNFADPIPFLVSPLFGESSSMLNLMLGTGSPGSGLAPIFQAGGARSVRFVLRFRF